MILWYSWGSFISSESLVNSKSKGIYFHSMYNSPSFLGIGIKKMLPSLSIQYGFSCRLGSLTSSELSYRLESYKGIFLPSKKAVNTSFNHVLSSLGCGNIYSLCHALTSVVKPFHAYFLEFTDSLENISL